jgi:hypothetical protein
MTFSTFSFVTALCDSTDILLAAAIAFTTPCQLSSGPPGCL